MKLLALAILAAVAVRPTARAPQAVAAPTTLTVERWNWDGSKPMRHTFAVADVVKVEGFSVKGIVGTRLTVKYPGQDPSKVAFAYYTPELPGAMRLKLQSMGWGQKRPTYVPPRATPLQ